MGEIPSNDGVSVTVVVVFPPEGTQQVMFGSPETRQPSDPSI